MKDTLRQRIFDMALLCWRKEVSSACCRGGPEAEAHGCGKGLGERAHYRSAGTVEFLVQQDTADFYFLEVNTRLQATFCLIYKLPVSDS